MTVRVFPEEISIWISGMNKVDCRPQCGRIRQSTEGPNRTKDGGREDCLPLPDFWAGHGSSALSAPGSRAFRLGLESTPLHQLSAVQLHRQLPQVSSLQMADGGASRPPSQPIPYKISYILVTYVLIYMVFYICIYIYIYFSTFVYITYHEI